MKYPKVNRVELIDNDGRAYSSGIGCFNVYIQLQDDGRTLMLFLQKPQNISQNSIGYINAGGINFNRAFEV